MSNANSAHARNKTISNGTVESSTQIAITKKPDNGKTIRSPYAAIGQDVVWYVSGSIDGGRHEELSLENRAVAVFGGDVVVSGSLRVEGGELAGSFNFDCDVLELTGSLEVQGNGVFTTGITGSITRLPDGSSFMTAGGGITILTASNGQVSISTPTIEWNERLGYGDGTTHVFDLDYEPNNPQTIMIFVNGVLQERDEGTADFSVDGATVTFNYVPPPGSKITATYARK